MQLFLVRAKVYGRVQGVGFRAYLRKMARFHNITGWVKNNTDGSVEFFAEGPEKSLLWFAAHARTGPKFALVNQFEEIEFKKIDVQNCVGFDVN